MYKRQGENWAIENISMRIENGKKVAFVGASGSGKSTLMKVMAGLIMPQKGNIHGTKGIYGCLLYTSLYYLRIHIRHQNYFLKNFKYLKILNLLNQIYILMKE